MRRRRWQALLAAGTGIAEAAGGAAGAGATALAEGGGALMKGIKAIPEIGGTAGKIIGATPVAQGFKAGIMGDSPIFGEGLGGNILAGAGNVLGKRVKGRLEGKAGPAAAGLSSTVTPPVAGASPAPVEIPGVTTPEPGAALSPGAMSGFAKLAAEYPEVAELAARMGVPLGGQ